MENVNHPSHYNQHPAGIECIDIIRHYTCDIANALKYLWRAGLKTDADKTPIMKEIEDLKKALWYIQDHNRYCVRYTCMLNEEEVASVVYEVTGYRVEQIFKGYPESIIVAMSHLLGVGIIFQGEIRYVSNWREKLTIANNAIQERKHWLEEQLETLNINKM